MAELITILMVLELAVSKKISDFFSSVALLLMPFTKIAQLVSLHRTKMATRALDEKCFKTASTEPLIQIQISFTGSAVVECLTRDLKAPGRSLNSNTALCP